MAWLSKQLPGAKNYFAGFFEILNNPFRHIVLASDKTVAFVFQYFIQ